MVVIRILSLQKKMLCSHDTISIDFSSFRIVACLVSLFCLVRKIKFFSKFTSKGLLNLLFVICTNNSYLLLKSWLIYTSNCSSYSLIVILVLGILDCYVVIIIPNGHFYKSFSLIFVVETLLTLLIKNFQYIVRQQSIMINP